MIKLRKLSAEQYTVGYANGATGITIGSTGASSIDAGGGDILIRGKGYSAFQNNSRGVLIGATAEIKTSGAGTITIVGEGGVSGTGNHGVYMVGDTTSGAQISSEDGAISITGTATGTGNMGIFMGANAGILSTDGDITLTTDTISIAGDDGAKIGSSGELLIQTHTTGGTIAVGAGAGTLILGTNTVLPALQDGFKLITIGREDATGAIAIRTSEFKDDVIIRGGSIQVQQTLSTGTGGYAGTITLEARGKILMNSSSKITTEGKTITLNSDRDGVNGGSIFLKDNTFVLSKGGDIIFSGGQDTTSDYATGTSSQINGVSIGSTGNISTVDAGGGNIVIRGKGYAGTDNANGVYIGSGAEITTTDAGTITIVGEGGGTNTGNNGVHITDGAQLLSGSGEISITGVATGTGNVGIFMGANTGIHSTGGNITLTTDTISIAGNNGAKIGSSGELLIQTLTAGKGIGIGNTTAGSLHLNHITALPALQDGFSLIRIGNESGGTVTIANQSGFTFKDNLLIRSGANISLQYSLSTGSGGEAGTITLEAAGDITVAGSATIKTDDKDIVLNANSDAVGYGVISLAGTAAIKSNGGEYHS